MTGRTQTFTSKHLTDRNPSAKSAQVSEENQGAFGMGDRGPDRLTESSGSLNDV